MRGRTHLPLLVYFCLEEVLKRVDSKGDDLDDSIKIVSLGLLLAFLFFVPVWFQFSTLDLFLAHGSDIWPLFVASRTCFITKLQVDFLLAWMMILNIFWRTGPLILRFLEINFGSVPFLVLKNVDHLYIIILMLQVNSLSFLLLDFLCEVLFECSLDVVLNFLLDQLFLEIRSLMYNEALILDVEHLAGIDLLALIHLLRAPPLCNICDWQ